MSWLKHVATSLGTLIGIAVEKTLTVIDDIKKGYESYRRSGGTVGAAACSARKKREDDLRETNDEMADIRRRARESNINDADRRRFDGLKERRNAAMREQEQAKEVKAAETIMAAEASTEGVAIDDQNIHILTANAFADVVNKRCPKCTRKMKLQWRRDLPSPTANDLFWGCTGWYFQAGNQRKCSHTEKLGPADRALMVDTSLPEFVTSADDLATIIAVPDVQETIIERVDDLVSDLRSRRKGVEIATCPVHGIALVLKKKSSSARGLLDMYYLRCPYWRPDDAGCPFMEKLKSPSQLAVLLKIETGSGIL